MKKRVEVIFWGVRGSIATHKLDHSAYGGHTSCVSISYGGSDFICDAGTGIRMLGQKIARKRSKTYLFLSHLHWDHLFGLPFFEPLYQKNRKIVLAGPKTGKASFKKTLQRVMAPPFFPINPKAWRAKIKWADLKPRKMKMDGVQFECRWVDHTDPAFGFKFVFPNGKKIIYVSDQDLKSKNKTFAKWINGADLLIHDSQYNKRQYARHKGWGHSNFEEVVKYAMRSGVKALALFHHDPDSSDAILKKRLEWCRKFLKLHGSAMKCLLAKEQSRLPF